MEDIIWKYSIDPQGTEREPIATQCDWEDGNDCQGHIGKGGGCKDAPELTNWKEKLQAHEVSVTPSEPRSSPLCAPATPMPVASAPYGLLLGDLSLSPDETDASLSFSPSPSECGLSARLEGSADRPDLFAATVDHDSSDLPESSSVAWLEIGDNMPLTPRVAKELSVAAGTFYQITTFKDGDLVPEDEPKDQGWVLQGYLCGKPVYLNTTGMYAELKAIETQTVLGRRYITQSIDNCFPNDLACKSLENSDPSEGKSLDAAFGVRDVALPVSSSMTSCSAESGISLEMADDLFEPTEPALTEPLEHCLPFHRTYSNDWIKVAGSPLGGYGIFAKVNIPKLTHILLEQPFMRLKNLSCLHKKYAKLTVQEKAVFDGFHPYDKNTDDPIQQRWSANSFCAKNCEVVLAIGSNFNHACHSKRTAQYCWDSLRDLMVFTAMSDIKRGDEIFISYGEYAHVLGQKYGFICRCGGCLGAGILHRGRNFW